MIIFLSNLFVLIISQFSLKAKNRTCHDMPFSRVTL